MKVYELAKELNLKSVELLDKLRKDYNMPVKNHMQSLSPADVKKIKSLFAKSKPALPVKKKTPAVKRKKKPVQKPTAPADPEEPVEVPVLRKGVVRRSAVKKTAPLAPSPADKKSKSPSPSSAQKSPPPSVEKAGHRETAPVAPATPVPAPSPAPTSLLGDSQARRGILTGAVVGDTPQDIFKITDKIEEPEAEKKKPKKPSEKESHTQQFRATDFRKREVIFQPKKKRVSTGLSSKKTQITTPKIHKRIIKMHNERISLEDIAQRMGVKTLNLVKKIKREGLLADSQVPAEFDFETAGIIADVFGFEVKNMMQDREQMIESLFFGNLTAEKQNKPPVVTVMGHVNHGKTTLLDFIRKSRVADREAGGITQHIGAYSVPAGKSFVTFIDTPGHSAFTAMRARGAKVTDIVVIVVSADDGVQPQTVEAINHAKTAGVPIIVAVNKVDLPSANVESAKKQLTEHKLVPEEWGGDTIFCSISALKGEGVKELLEHIQLVAEVNELKANPARSATGVVIESRLEKGRGRVMTLLVQDGTLESGQVLIADNQVGRARQMTDDMGRALKSAGPGRPVEISGFSEPVQTGAPFYVVKSEKDARRLILSQTKDTQEEKSSLSAEELLFKTHDSKTKVLKMVLKTDVTGSMEAVEHSIQELNTEDVEVKIIHSHLGAINESDVLLAGTAGAVLVGFNVPVDSKAQKLLKKHGLAVKTYKVIYDLLKDTEKIMAGLLDPEIKESFGGRAEVQQVFPISHVGLVAGCKVAKGKIVSSHLARLIRDKQIIYEGKIVSLKKFQQPVKEVSEGQECGIGLEHSKDLKQGDIIESFTRTEIKRETLSRA